MAKAKGFKGLGFWGLGFRFQGLECIVFVPGTRAFRVQGFVLQALGAYATLILTAIRACPNVSQTRYACDVWKREDGRQVLNPACMSADLVGFGFQSIIFCSDVKARTD